MISPARRRSLTLATCLLGTAVGSLVLAGPAAAEVPLGWPDSPAVGTWAFLVVLAGIPLLLTLVITLAVYAPALVKGERVTPGATTPESQWIGGPRSSAEESPAPDSAHSDAGGAGGRW